MARQLVKEYDSFASDLRGMRGDLTKLPDLLYGMLRVRLIALAKI